MKKLALAALVLGVSTIAAANSVTYYAQGNVSYNKSRANGGAAGNIKDSTPAYKVALGKDFGDARYAVDYTYHDKIENNAKTTKVDAHSIGLTGYYDFETNSNLTPYVGVRASVNHLELKEPNANGTRTKKKDRIGGGLVVGAQYNISPALAVDAGVEFNHMGKVNSTTVKQYGATVGARVNF